MMMPEDEAKLKWCPLARAVRGDGVSAFNRGTDMQPDVATFCIGSDCMAWRSGVWKHQRNLKPEDRTPGVGFCGAFGRPA